MSNQRVVVLTDEEIAGGLKLLKTALGNGIMGAKLGAPVDSSIPEWLVSLTEKFQHPGGITDDMIARAKDAYNHTLVSTDPWRAALEAALFPGDGEQ